jgi:DNA-binding transcriptional ArsR family regulator
MARAATSADVFNAVGEPTRRAIIGLLAGGRGRDVGDLVRALRRPQPAVSKHLRVLRDVGVVEVRRHGRHRVYELNAGPLKPVHDWVSTFERFWSDQLARIKARAEEVAAGQNGDPNAAEQPPHHDN